MQFHIVNIRCKVSNGWMMRCARNSIVTVESRHGYSRYKPRLFGPTGRAQYRERLDCTNEDLFCTVLWGILTTLTALMHRINMPFHARAFQIHSMAGWLAMSWRCFCQPRDTFQVRIQIEHSNWASVHRLGKVVVYLLFRVAPGVAVRNDSHETKWSAFYSAHVRSLFFDLTCNSSAIIR